MSRDHLMPCTICGCACYGDVCRFCRDERRREHDEETADDRRDLACEAFQEATNDD